jgi:predicted tellurium resistance membrane protein TerC
LPRSRSILPCAAPCTRKAMANLVLSGVLAIGIGGGHALLLRRLTNWAVRGGAIRALLVAAVVLRLVLVTMIAAVLLLWGPGLAVWALAACWIGRTMALAHT